jgi:2,3-bisphosphoglycerate-dependent phosphoglycerate mutase
MQIYFIRHAQSNNNALYSKTGKFDGRNEDPELSIIGEQQAQLLVDYFAANQVISPEDGNRDIHNRLGFQFTHMYSSPMIRAVETGLGCAQVFGLSLKLWVDLHEGGGIFLENEKKENIGLPGKPRSYFAKRFPGLLPDEAMSEEGWWNRPFEPYGGRVERAKRVWERINLIHGPQDKIVLFSHLAFFNYFLSALVGSPESELVRFHLSNTGISRIDLHPDRSIKEIVYVNKLDHLPAGLIT